MGIFARYFIRLSINFQFILSLILIWGASSFARLDRLALFILSIQVILRSSQFLFFKTRSPCSSLSSIYFEKFSVVFPTNFAILLFIILICLFQLVTSWNVCLPVNFHFVLSTCWLVQPFLFGGKILDTILSSWIPSILIAVFAGFLPGWLNWFNNRPS